MLAYWPRRKWPTLARHAAAVCSAAIERCRWIHTIGMRFPIDVAYLSDDGIVVKTMHMNRFRVGIPVWRASWVIEAEGGAFGRWGLRVGDEVEVRHGDSTTP